MNLWFSSDPHFRHYNIIEYSNRPFKSALEMDECMIEQHNLRVKPSDHWYCIGDVSMMRPRLIADIMARLNGHKRLVRGNHDIYKTKEYMEVGFEEIYGVRVLDNLLFTHIPVHPASLGRFAANVHGHTHCNNYEPVERHKVVNGVIDLTRPYLIPYINICVEQTNYAPVDLAWLKERIKLCSD